MTKSSAEILGLPVISITEGRELGISKTLVVDARRGAVAAITIEDEDWYRGVKLLPSPLLSTKVMLNLLPSMTCRGASTVNDVAAWAMTTVIRRIVMLIIRFIDNIQFSA